MSVLFVIGLAELIERLVYFAVNSSKKAKRAAYRTLCKRAMQARREKRREFY